MHGVFAIAIVHMSVSSYCTINQNPIKIGTKFEKKCVVIRFGIKISNVL